MSRNLSQLIYSKLREAPGDRRVITLHRYNEMFDSVREMGLAANPEGSVIGLQASKGVYLSRTITGYMWFVGPNDRPSPVHFGDAMQEIERFLWDEFDRQSGEARALPFLVGAEQGGIMATAMAGATPDLLSGIVSIDANLPVVPGWEPPLAPLDNLPILLINQVVPVNPQGPVLSGDALAAELESWGGVVTQATTASEADRDATIAGWIAAQPVRRRRA